MDQGQKLSCVRFLPAPHAESWLQLPSATLRLCLHAVLLLQHAWSPYVWNPAAGMLSASQLLLQGFAQSVRPCRASVRLLAP